MKHGGERQPSNQVIWNSNNFTFMEKTVAACCLAIPTSLANQKLLKIYLESAWSFMAEMMKLFTYFITSVPILSPDICLRIEEGAHKSQ